MLKEDLRNSKTQEPKSRVDVSLTAPDRVDVFMTAPGWVDVKQQEPIRVDVSREMFKKKFNYPSYLFNF